MKLNISISIHQHKAQFKQFTSQKKGEFMKCDNFSNFT